MDKTILWTSGVSDSLQIQNFPLNSNREGKLGGTEYRRIPKCGCQKNPENVEKAPIGRLRGRTANQTPIQRSGEGSGKSSGEGF